MDVWITGNVNNISHGTGYATLLSFPVVSHFTENYKGEISQKTFTPQLHSFCYYHCWTAVSTFKPVPVLSCSYHLFPNLATHLSTNVYTLRTLKPEQ